MDHYMNKKRLSAYYSVEIRFCKNILLHLRLCIRAHIYMYTNVNLHIQMYAFIHCLITKSSWTLYMFTVQFEIDI